MRYMDTLSSFGISLVLSIYSVGNLSSYVLNMRLSTHSLWHLNITPAPGSICYDSYRSCSVVLALILLLCQRLPHDIISGGMKISVTKLRQHNELKAEIKATGCAMRMTVRDIHVTEPRVSIRFILDQEFHQSQYTVTDPHDCQAS
ncbi:hypothetical protein TWF103_009829 [Orbilia oligospora]|nr:hypothetical protein TWF103_009829 [Orbilia oligospora]